MVSFKRFFILDNRWNLVIQSQMETVGTHSVAILSLNICTTKTVDTHKQTRKKCVDAMGCLSRWPSLVSVSWTLSFYVYPKSFIEFWLLTTVSLQINNLKFFMKIFQSQMVLCLLFLQHFILKENEIILHRHI